MMLLACAPFFRPTLLLCLGSLILFCPGLAGAELGGSASEPELRTSGVQEGPTPPPSGPENPEGRTTAAPEIDELLSLFEFEPPVGQVQSWAVERAGAAPERALVLLRDARARGALPLIRLRGRYEDQSGTKWDELNLMDSRDRDSEYTLDLWLEWDLSELASNSDALRAVREGRALAELRQAVVHQVTVAFFDRRRLLAEQHLARSDERIEETVLRRLRVQELTATLDGLTGGRWSEALAETAGVSSSSDPTRDPVATEADSDPQGEDPGPGLRVPVHPVDRSSDP
ncbi:MAG: hypothetical protein VX498_05305 [Myxococcota bacterium]|nr:hypothetical protein [Myxococcota bacterium]